MLNIESLIFTGLAPKFKVDCLFIFSLSNCITYFIKFSDEDGIVAGNESLENAGKSYFNIKQFRSLFIVIGNNVQMVFYVQVSPA
jgi:hypothetical protein